MPQIPQAPGTNDPSEHFLSVGGEDIIGFGNDGGITYEEPNEKALMAMGIDGKVQISRRRGQRPRVAVVTLKVTSLGYGHLARFFVAQDAQPKILPLGYNHLNGNTGTNVSSAYCVFLDEPIDPMQANDPEITLRLGLPSAKVDRATLNVAP